MHVLTKRNASYMYIRNIIKKTRSTVHVYIYIYSAPIKNLVQFRNGTTLLPSSGTGYPVLEPAAPFENWTSMLVFRARAFRV